MSKFIRWFFMLSWFEHFLGQRCQWYRRWYGGRWEKHWIDICASDIWLSMSNNPARQWPAYRQPCSFGTPLIEDWPIPASAACNSSEGTAA